MAEVQSEVKDNSVHVKYFRNIYDKKDIVRFISIQKIILISTFYSRHMNINIPSRKFDIAPQNF